MESILGMLDHHMGFVDQKFRTQTLSILCIQYKQSRVKHFSAPEQRFFFWGPLGTGSILSVDKGAPYFYKTRVLGGNHPLMPPPLTRPFGEYSN
jgi:hypothetical protein